MATGIQISDFTVIWAAVIGGVSYVLKSWLDASRKISDKRASECEEFAKLLYDFSDNHRAHRKAELKAANDNFRGAVPSLIIWASVNVEKKLDVFLTISNEYAKRILTDETIPDTLEKKLIVSMANLHHALRMDALGWSLQGICLRYGNFRELKKYKKEKKAK